MNDRKFPQGPSFWLSIGLIILGLYLLLENFGFFYIGDLWDYWPLILVAIGLVKLIGSNFKDVYSSSILIVVGFLFFLVKMDYIYFSDIWDFWPLILILIGGKIIWNHYVHRTKPGYREAGSSTDRIDSVAIFGGREIKVTSDQFEGGNITTMFGGTEIYLANSRLAPGKNILDVFVMFGGTELYVPRNWNVVMKGLPLFGGFEDARKYLQPDEVSTEDTLVIKGLVMFGGFSIKDAV